MSGGSESVAGELGGTRARVDATEDPRDGGLRGQALRGEGQEAGSKLRVTVLGREGSVLLGGERQPWATGGQSRACVRCAAG